jgi:uncharacterized protein YbbC (DUF1343 family)
MRKRRLLPSLLTGALLVLGASIGATNLTSAANGQEFGSHDKDKDSDKNKGHVKPGIEVLLEHPETLAGKKVGLVTNPTGVTSDLTHDVDALLEKHVNLVAVYGPEHGVRGTEQAGSAPGTLQDPKTGLPFYNLYGKTPQQIAPIFNDVDVILFDIQDVGARFYTYISTMAYAMEAAALDHKKFIVLDRPNPIGGTKVEGPVLNPAFSSFVGLFPIPVRHGMTVGELAMMFNNEFLPKDIGTKADLEVIKMEGWHRDMWYDDTGLPWVMPSPNMPTLDTATVYPGQCLFEGTNLSEGRGTTRPFELIGAPYIESWKLVDALNAKHLSGVAFREAYFQPTFSKYTNQSVGGLQIYVTNREAYQPVRTALTIIDTVKKLYPNDFQWRSDNWIDKLLGTDTVRKELDTGESVDDIVAEWQKDLDAFKQLREKYLLY